MKIKKNIEREKPRTRAKEYKLCFHFVISVNLQDLNVITP